MMEKDKSTASASVQPISSDASLHTLTNDATRNSDPGTTRNLSIETDDTEEGKSSPQDGETVHDEEASAGAQQESAGKEEHALQDQSNLLPMKQLIVVFAGLSCAFYYCCCQTDKPSVSTALPTLGRVFNDASIESWVGTSYLLTSTACQPLYGRMSDIFGRKFVLLGSMLFFLIGSILCAVSQSMIMLIVFRAISGIGGGGILTSVMIVTSDVVSLEKRGMYQGILGMVVALANSLGPLVGGAFSEKVSWRWCFYINIPLTSIAILVVAVVLPLKRVKGDFKEKLKKIDYLGSLTMLAASILILLPLSWGGTQYAWSSAACIAPLVIGVCLIGAFIYIEMKVATLPLIPLHIFKNSTVAGANGGAFFTGFMFYCNLYYLPQFYQVVRGASPIHSGVMLLPLVLFQTITSFTAGALVSKTGNYQLNLWFGFGIWAIGCGLLSTISPAISNAKLIGYQILSGIGAGQTFQTSLIAIQASVARKDMAVATGTRNFLRLFGGTIALAACAAILNNTSRNELSSVLTSAQVSAIISDPTQIKSASLGLTESEQAAALLAYTHGIRNIYYFMIPCCCISFFLTLFFVKGTSLKREDDARKEKEGKEWAAQHRTRDKLKFGAQKASKEASESRTEDVLVTPSERNNPTEKGLEDENT